MDNSSWTRTFKYLICTLKACSFNLFHFDVEKKSRLSITISSMLNWAMVFQVSVVGYNSANIFGDYLGDDTSVTYLANIIEIILTTINYLTFYYVGILNQLYQSEIVQILKSLEIKIKKLDGASQDIENFSDVTRRKCNLYLIQLIIYFGIFCFYFFIFYVVKGANIFLCLSSFNFFIFIMYHISLTAIMCSVVLVLENYNQIINSKISELLIDYDSDKNDIHRTLTYLFELRHELSQVFTNIMSNFGIFLVVSFLYCSLNSTVQLYMLFILFLNNDFSMQHTLSATMVCLWMIPVIYALQFFGMKCTRLSERRQETQNILRRNSDKSHIKKVNQMLLSLVDNDELESSGNGFMIINESVIFRVSYRFR